MYLDKFVWSWISITMVITDNRRSNHKIRRHPAKWNLWTNIKKIVSFPRESFKLSDGEIRMQFHPFVFEPIKIMLQKLSWKKSNLHKKLRLLVLHTAMITCAKFPSPSSSCFTVYFLIPWGFIFPIGVSALCPAGTTTIPRPVLVGGSMFRAMVYNWKYMICR